ncbi:hypothetical protein LINPERPRIM_LOCUS22187 [Linum perenne]
MAAVAFPQFQESRNVRWQRQPSPAPGRFAGEDGVFFGSSLKVWWLICHIRKLSDQTVFFRSLWCVLEVVFKGSFGRSAFGTGWQFRDSTITHSLELQLTNRQDRLNQNDETDVPRQNSGASFRLRFCSNSWIEVGLMTRIDLVRDSLKGLLLLWRLPITLLEMERSFVHAKNVLMGYIRQHGLW